MNMKRLIAVALGGLLIVMATVAAGPARPAGNPTPCYGSQLHDEIDLNNTVEQDSDVDGDTNEVLMYLNANASGFQPYCYYSYTLYLSAWNGPNISGTAHIRVWVCNTYEGDFSQPFVQQPAFSYTTPQSWYYGSCKKQADNLNTFFSNADNNFFKVYFYQWGYLNYN